MSTPTLTADDITLPVKRTTGDTLEDRLTSNAYNNILPARYLRKDENGDLIEQPEDLFERVAKNIALAEAVYEAEKHDIEITVTPDQLKPDHPRRDELASEVFGQGTATDDDVETTLTEHNVNKFAYDTIVPTLPHDIKTHVESVATDFQDQMESLSFMPNSPTLMNAGDELQQLSACFVMSPDDDLTDIHEKATDAAKVFQCLTADSTVETADKGIVSVADVTTDDRILQRTDDGFRYQPVEEVHSYDDAPTLEVELTDGRSIRGTPNHRLKVDGAWRRLDEIQAGQQIHHELGWIREIAREPPVLEPVSSGPRWDDTRRVSNTDIIDLHSQGLSDYQIADRLDCGKSTVQRRRAEELNLPPNGTGGRHPGSTSFDEPTALALHQEGKTESVIADHLAVSPSTIGRFRARNGLEPNGTPVKSVEQPDYLTEELAELVGLWVGDGSWHQDGVRFHVGRESVADYIDHLAKRLFGTATSSSYSEGCYEVGINSHEIKRWWKANFDCKPDGAQTARIPQAVKNAPAGIVMAFLRGLFTADGTLLDETYPKLYSSSERLIDDTATLMLGLGYPIKKRVLRDDDTHPYYGLIPTTGDARRAFLHEIGFIDERNEIGVASTETVASRDSYSMGDEYTVTVESVSESDPATVYDITVADRHEYITDGIVSHNSGGGCGYAFWRLRPYGDPVGSTGGIASGPLTFMETFDQMCETIAQGGTRRGAQMAIMRVSHPDVVEFIHSKNKDVSLAHTLKLNDPDDFTYTTFNEALEEARELIDEEGRVPKHLRNAVEGHLSNFNISVGVTDTFMEALQNDEEYTFVNPRTGEPHVASAETKEMYERYDLGEYVTVGEELRMPASVLWERIVAGAWENGEPGVIYLDRVNQEHSFPVESTPTGDSSEYEILATNPCVTGETKIATADGRGSVRIDELAEKGEAVPVFCLNEETGDVEVQMGRDPRLTQRNAELVRVETDEDVFIRCTTDHEIPTQNRGVVEAGELRPGDSLHILDPAEQSPNGVMAPAGNHKVSRVEPDGQGDVYNITVDRHHNYYAGIDAGNDVFVNVKNCGEQPLMEYEACNLGHINLSTIASESPPDWRLWSTDTDVTDLESSVSAFLEDAIDWDEFDRRIELGTRFLENVVTMSDFPVEEIERSVYENRKIGLGIMGLAQLNIQLGVRYGSDPANEIARQLMMHINHGSKWASHELAEDRGSFANWGDSKYADPLEYQEWFEHQTGLDAHEWEDGFPTRNHNTTTIAPTGCVEENSLVSTAEGLQPIKALDNTEMAEFDQWGEIDMRVATDGGTKAATAVFDNGFADVKTIETAGGFSVTATPTHRFRTIDAEGEYVWKEARLFEADDPIVLHRGTHTSGTDVALDTSERQNYHHNTSESLSLPAELTPALAEFLGYYMGDGYVHTDVGVKLVVDSTKDALDTYLRELGQAVFGVEPTVEEKGTRHMLCFGGRHLPRYFKDNGWVKAAGNTGEGAAGAFVPDEILQADPDCARAFLRGLFEADGTASRKIELSTVSETLAETVQTLLLGLGIVFVRNSLDADELGENHYGNRTRHILRGANKLEDKRFLEEIGFITKSTDITLTNQSYKNDTYPPALIESVRSVPGYASVSTDIKRRVNQSREGLNGSLSRQTIREVEAQTGSTVTVEGRAVTDLYVDTVSSVADDVAYTKDISVPENNTYIANGFVTHNTTSMVGNTTGGCEPIYNVAYYKNVSDDVQGDEMLVEFDDYFLRVLEANDIDVDAVKAEAQEQMAENAFDGVEGLSSVPDAIGELFVVTSDVAAKEHAMVQCACQAGVDSAISKTVNAPNSASESDAAEVFEYIYEHGGKGVTYYRDGTRSKQVLTTRAQNAEFAELDEAEAAEVLLEQIEEVFGGVEGFLEQDTIRDVVTDEVSALVEAGEYAEMRPRPDVLHGVTQRIETGYGKLYVNINEDEDGRPFELFATIGNSGGFTNSFTEALAKTVSTALRSGVDPRELADELQGIRSPKVAWDKGEQIQSIPDAVGTAMARYLDGDLRLSYPQQRNLDEVAGSGELPGEEPDGGSTVVSEDSTQSLIDAGESPECPECGSMSLYYAEGCKTCEACGWSEC